MSPKAPPPIETGPLVSPAEREALGKKARKNTPRSSHGAWEPNPQREDPVTILERQAESRVAELVPIRYGRMMVSPFTFYRGAAAIMSADLADTPTSGFRAQLCGDAHLSNFGGFASPEREMLFDINDFDETLPGPWEWDLKRLTASMALAGGDQGFDSKQIDDIVLWTARTYREAMWNFAGMGDLAVWYARLNADDIVGRVREQQLARKKRLQKLERNLGKARAKNSTRAVAKLTETVDGQLRFVSEPPLIVPVEELLPEDQRQELVGRMNDLVEGYRSSLPDDRRRLLDGYRFQSMARKVVGVGSVGTRAWVLLLVGRDEQDPLVLQAKEAQDSVLEPYVGASEYSNHGQRVVEGQRLMQAASDIFLGWLPAKGADGEERDFYVRQLWDGKLSIDIEPMGPEQLRAYGRLCGWTLARCHARSGDRIAIAAYLGSNSTFDRAMVEFSRTYAEQSESDYRKLLAAVESGRLQAENP
jgi:uncharacterized protein (DUF2252 family)